MKPLSVLFLLAAIARGSLLGATENAGAPAGDWIPLVNGKNLDGWTVKVAKHPLGVNHADRFRVEDGIIKVAHDK